MLEMEGGWTKDIARLWTTGGESSSCETFGLSPASDGESGVDAEFDE